MDVQELTADDVIDVCVESWCDKVVISHINQNKK
jgi:hypothetical protein